LVHLTHNLQWLLSDSITSLLIVNSPSSLAFQLLSFVSQAGAYLVNVKTISAFTNEEEAAVELADIVPFSLQDKLIERGATHTEAANFQQHVVVSDSEGSPFHGRLVTGQNPASAKGVGEEVVKLLQHHMQGAEVAV
jgi:putative intracellular protease/amidase